METDFIALKKARLLVSDAFNYITKLDKFDPLRNQASRSAISIVSNIAEGNERRGKDRQQLFRIAKGSLAELNEQLLLVPVPETHAIYNKINELHKILYSLSQSPSQSKK